MAREFRGFLDRDLMAKLERGLGGSWHESTGNLRRLQLARAPDSNANKAVGIDQGYSGTTVTIV